MSDIHIPFTYCLTFIPTGQRYYGVKTAKKCKPSDLWTKYFTSSKIVHRLIDQFGTDAFKPEIRHIFSTKDVALKWEEKVLRRLNAVKSSHWLNMQNAGKHFVYTDNGRKGKPGTFLGKNHTPEAKAKVGAKSKGRGLGVKRSDITRAKISNALKGKTKTPEHVAKIVANRIYVISDETREKHRILSTGRKQSDAAKLKKSIALKGRKQPTQNCPYCNKSIGGKTNFSKHTRICQEKLIHQ